MGIGTVRLFEIIQKKRDGIVGIITHANAAYGIYQCN